MVVFRAWLLQASPDAIKSNLIRSGRAMVEVVEKFEVLKENAGSWREMLLISLTHDLYKHRLERALATLPREAKDEIMKASRAN